MKSPFLLQGIPALEIVEKYGTPLYVYDASIIEAQYRKFLEAFSLLPVKLRYACKALSNVNILQLLKKWGCGVDTVSIQEVELALWSGFRAKDIIFTPNCISFEEIQQVVEKNILVNIEDLHNLENFGRLYASHVPCCIRLKPHILAGGNFHIQTGHADSKFGISIYDMEEIISIVKKYQIHVIGLHVHSGSEIKTADQFLQGAEILFQTALRFPSLEFLDLGSGFKVAYKKDDKVLNLADLAQKIYARWQSFSKDYGKSLELWFEPGKFLVSQAGYFLVKTNVIKKGNQIPFAGVDSGFNHLVRPMLYDAYHEILNLSNPDGQRKSYNVVGYICETDTFAKEREIPEIRVGDILCFCNAGAYGFSMSSQYNSRLRPAEVLIYQGKDYLIRHREKWQDLLQNQVLWDLDKDLYS